MYLLTAIVALTSLFAPPVGVWLMKKSIWFPFGLAISLDLACYPFMLALPETWKPDHLSSSPATSREESPLLGEVEEPSPVAESECSLESTHGSVGDGLGKIRNRLSTTFELFLIPNLRLSFIFFFLRAIAVSNTTFIIQYASKKLSWELSETAWLLVIRSGGSFLTTALVLPMLTSYLLGAKGVLPQQLDLRIIRASLVILTLGYLCIAEASNALFLVAGKCT